MKVPALEKLLDDLVPKAYWVPMLNDIDSDSLRISIEQRRGRDGRDRWAVLRNELVLNSDGEWEYEPSPSSRDEAFLKRCRYADLTSASLALVRWLNNRTATRMKAFNNPDVTKLPATPAALAPVSGSAATLEQLVAALDGLVQECEYSASSGLPFNFPEGQGHWTQLGKAKALLADLRQNNKEKDQHDPPRRRPARKGAKLRPKRS